MDEKIFFITGGGTGGHIYPAIAVADRLLKDNNTKIYYIGNPKNLEAEIVKGKKYTFLPIITFGMPRKLSIKIISWVITMFFAWLKCCYYILKYKPVAVFGTGGYVSAPVLFAALVTNTPYTMHDCDANTGLVTRSLAPYAKSVSVAFDLAKHSIKNENVYVNGNPIRSDFAAISKEEARNILAIDNRLTLCIMGGSQGAKTINNSAVKILKQLSKEYNLQVIFQTGKSHYEQITSELLKLYPEYKNDKNLIIRPYFDNMASILKASDIAVSRAGSVSISELCASSVATIFIPYPHAAADHQRKNARYIVDKGAGLYLEDAQTTPEKLLSLISTLIKNPEALKNMQSRALSLAKFDGVEKIVEQIYSSIHKS